MNRERDRDRGSRPAPAASPWDSAGVTRKPAPRGGQRGKSEYRDEQLTPARRGEERKPIHRGEVNKPAYRDGQRKPPRRDEERTSVHRDDERKPTPRNEERRLYGLNACLAAFAKRPEALRKVYLVEARIPALKDVLAWCVARRLGYRVVEEVDLDKLAASRHHEGVCFDMLRTAPLSLDALLAQVPAQPSPSLLLWLDGVGNPHNFGALLRTAAHFAAHGVLAPAADGLEVSGAAARVAEGAAEVVPFAQAESAAAALAALRARGYSIAATVPRDGVPLYATALPARLALVFGAEGEGMSTTLIDAADLRLTISGSRAIDSLNVSASVAVVLGEYWRQHGAPRGGGRTAG